MSMKNKLMNDLKTAMKEKDTVKKATIIMLKAAIKQIEVDKRIEVEDDVVLEIIQKQIKQKKAALEEFKKASRSDLVLETEKEIDILNEYLPEQLSIEELKQIIAETIKEVEASTMKDMGKVMTALKDKTAARADGKTLSMLVRESLNN